VVVADEDGSVIGGAIALFRPRAAVARLYSIAVAPHAGGRGIGAMLLAAAEEAAVARDCHIMRLEVRETNAAAIARYRKSGYREFGRRLGYYEDGGDALRFQKRLLPGVEVLKAAPPYFHQTSEFTCGPACVMMALGWADSGFRPDPALEFQLWREATMIFMTKGHGGCGPFGLAVALKRRGLLPEVYVNRLGPYFLDTVVGENKRRVMRLMQAQFRSEAAALDIPSHLTPLSESDLMAALDAGSVAIVLVSGYQMIPRKVPHWVFAFGREGRQILVHDPSAINDEDGMTAATYAASWPTFERMTRVGAEALTAAIVIGKGPPQ
jgi:hypothetical protein